MVRFHLVLLLECSIISTQQELAVVHLWDCDGAHDFFHDISPSFLQMTLTGFSSLLDLNAFFFAPLKPTRPRFSRALFLVWCFRPVAIDNILSQPLWIQRSTAPLEKNDLYESRGKISLWITKWRMAVRKRLNDPNLLSMSVLMVTVLF